MQRGSLAAVLRVVRFELPDASKLGIPDTVMNLAHTGNGIQFYGCPRVQDHVKAFSRRQHLRRHAR